MKIKWGKGGIDYSKLPAAPSAKRKEREAEREKTEWRRLRTRKRGRHRSRPFIYIKAISFRAGKSTVIKKNDRMEMINHGIFTRGRSQARETS